MKRVTGHAKIVTSLLLLTGWILLGAGCGTPPKTIRPDPEIERNVSLARNAFASGAPGKAVTYYRKALNRARLTDNPAAIGRNAYNLAACLTRLHQYKEADTLLDEAESEFQRVGINAREVPLLKARIARQKGQTAIALALAQSHFQVMTAKDPYFLQYQILLADLLCVKGDAAGAVREMDRVNRKSLAAAEPGIQADVAWVRARMALMEKKPREAGSFLDAAAAHFQKAGQYVEMALALDAAGHAYETAGDSKTAVDRYYRAARTLFLSGQVDKGEQVMLRAILLVDQSGQTKMQKKLKQLQADMNAVDRGSSAR